MARKRKNYLNRKLLIAVLAVLILVLVLILLLRQPKKIATIPSTNPVNTSNKASTAAPPSSGSQSSSSQNAAQSTKSSSNPPASSSGSGPVTPYGDFVSSHHVGTSTSMYSVCNTSPGSSCYIQFTNGDLVRKLDAQTTDANGATYWYWNTSYSSLSSGSWTITAVATLNGQTKTATDAQPLVVK